MSSFENIVWAEDFLTVSAELCDEVSAELCGVEELSFYPSASATFGEATFGDATLLDTDVIDNYLIDDFTMSGDFGIDCAAVALPVAGSLEVQSRPLDTQILTGHSVCVSAFACDESKSKLEDNDLIFALAPAFPTPALAKPLGMGSSKSSKNGYSFDDKKCMKCDDYDDEDLELFNDFDVPSEISTKEAKRRNRARAALVWRKKKERLALQALLPPPPVPVPNARKEAAARRVRQKGRFKKLGSDDSPDTGGHEHDPLQTLQRKLSETEIAADASCEAIFSSRSNSNYGFAGGWMRPTL